jgi:hypothetical protein
MSTDPGNRAYSDLVGGLLDARDDPATARFDAELATAVERGDVSDDTARRLKFWQRASLRALTDHTRTVLPTALGALEASRREARENAATDADLLDQEVEPAAEPDPGSEGTEDTEDTEDTVDEPTDPPVGEAPAEVDLRDTPGTASTSPAPGPSSLGGRAHRMIIAGLVPALPVRPEQF